MTAHIRIRQSEDLDTLLDLDRRVFPHDERIAVHDGVWWLADACIGGVREPVAFAGALLGADGLFLSRAGVIPEARGGGIQRKLIRVRERWARAHGVERVWTYTWWGNTRSQASLAREGYAPFKYEVVEDGKLGVRFLYWQKNLATST